MTSSVRRAGGFAVVGSLALAGPSLGAAAAVPFALVAVLAAFAVDEDNPLFELFARYRDRRDGRLYGLIGFSLAATGLAILATVPRVPLPMEVYVASVVLLAYGNLGEHLVRQSTREPFVLVTAFTVTGFVAAVVAQVAVELSAGSVPDLPTATFLAATGVLVAALLRAVLYRRDDPLVMLSTGLLLWMLASLPLSVATADIGFALAVTLVLGYVSYALETASVAGMLTGVLLGLLTIVLGGIGWFAILISFFGIGGLSTKFRYEAKRERGVAEDNEGARGSGNVLGNSTVAMVAVLGFAASPELPFAHAGSLFKFAFAGSLAAAMSDTLSSEIGGLFDKPRLITTLERVDAGTDGGVTWQGEVAGVAGAGLIAVIGVFLLPLDPLVPAAAAVVLGGFGGMTIDSLLGATVEDVYVGNQTVNFLATLTGALLSTGAALVLV